MPPQQSYVHKGITLKYRVFGSGDPLLFLHGVGVSTKSYANCLRLLSAHYTVIAPDIPGFGASSIPPEIWDFHDYANFFNEFLISRDVQEKITVVGHSFGGGVALHLAGVLPNIKQLVLIDSAGIPPHKSFYSMAYTVLIKKTFNNIIHYRNFKILSVVVADFVSTMLRNNVSALKLMKIIRKSAAHKPENLIVDVPSIIIWADKDEVFPIATTESLRQYVKVPVIKIIDDYHDWVVFKPEALPELIAGNVVAI